MATKNRKKPSDTTFESDTHLVFSRLHESLRAVLEELPGVVHRASDVREVLKIDKTLAWQVFKFGKTADPIASATDLPGTAALHTFLDAAEKRGVGGPAIKSAQSAVQELKRLIADHAGDRKTFDAMVRGLTGGNSVGGNVPSRRAAFRSNSHIWGVQASTRFSMVICHPSDDGQHVDLANIRGVMGLRRLRNDTPFALTERRTASTSAVPLPVTREPLDARGAVGEGVSFLQRFCSQPLPEFRNVVDSDNYVRTEIVTSAIGNIGAIDAVLGDVVRHADDRFSQPQNEEFQLIMRVLAPFEKLVMDFLVLEGTFGKRPIRLHGEVYSALYRQEVPDFRKEDILSPPINVEFLGRGISAMHSETLPRHSEMAAYAVERLGWDGSRFDVYRCSVEYPVMPSSVVVRFDLPEKP